MGLCRVLEVDPLLRTGASMNSTSENWTTVLEFTMGTHGAN
jgi:hypothetical protein